MSSVSFLEMVKAKSKDNIYLVKGIDREVECWYYIEVAKIADSLFKNSVSVGQKSDLTTYGKIIVSGWGAEPHEHIVEKIEKVGAAYDPKSDQEWQDIIDSKTNIYYVQAKDSNGDDFHAYVAVNGLMADKFIEDANFGNFNVNNYGDVVLIDWGFPSEQTKRMMTEEYGVDHDYIDSVLKAAGEKVE